MKSAAPTPIADIIVRAKEFQDRRKVAPAVNEEMTERELDVWGFSHVRIT